VSRCCCTSWQHSWDTFEGISRFSAERCWPASGPGPPAARGVERPPCARGRVAAGPKRRASDSDDMTRPRALSRRLTAMRPMRASAIGISRPSSC
jgi:hypothetical protein